MAEPNVLMLRTHAEYLACRTRRDLISPVLTERRITLTVDERNGIENLITMMTKAIQAFEAAQTCEPEVQAHR